nr:probable inactive leucine-rich repeat receptor-like protein kinase At3g03770 isoform X1 [Ziziphus jujuba var. spinosa]XP_048330903.1 probable inactive leucine-rich repeat receptor-like protein kinase At3g03770 isoform X1 [Ziziphus jujuba var. spinosa]
MEFRGLFFLFWFSWSFLFGSTYQLQSSETQVLLQLRRHLEYPKELEIWNQHGIDFCSLPSSTQVNITCQENLLTELRILGDKPFKVSDFNGFAIPNQTLSESFSIDSFFTTIARLNSLKVLSLASLGIWGPIPDKIHRLSSLEYLDLGSNFLFGSIPPTISRMEKLQTLIMDYNFLNDTVPGWYDSLSNLKILSLRNNRLKGPFPSSIGRITTLTDLTMSNNEISGKLPDLGSLKNLSVLDLSGNKLSSTLPQMPKGLVMIFLSNNSFSGEIPKQYGHLSGLQHLDLSSNTLRGIPPTSLFTLPNISYLNLASNMLSGSLPDHLSCGSKLRLVSMSNNMLTGALPSCLRSEKREVNFDGNCLSTDIKHQHKKSHCENVTLKSKQSRGKNLAILVGVILGILVLMLVLALGFLVLCRRYCPRGLSEQHLLHKSVQDSSTAGFSTELLSNARFISEAAKLGTQGQPVCRSFSLEELMEATNNFDNSAFIGEGSYGKLFKGRLENGNQVAIRCLPLSKKFSIRNLKLRLDLLSKLQHQHLVYLLGHCLGDGGRAAYNLNKVYLVYEYVPNGSFRDHLCENSSRKVLNWSERLAVLIGVAKAVHFLHTGIIPGFFTNRLKTNNILLNEHGMAKLSDYGLSIVSEETEKYVAKGDATKTWQLTSIEDDAYSFGFILLEAIVGPSQASKREAFILKEMFWNSQGALQSKDGQKRIVEPVVLATCSQESLSIVITIMNKCISPDASRPSFEDILWNLQYAAQVQATADGDQRTEAAS